MPCCIPPRRTRSGGGWFAPQGLPDLVREVPEGRAWPSQFHHSGEEALGLLVSKSQRCPESDGWGVQWFGSGPAAAACRPLPTNCGRSASHTLASTVPVRRLKTSHIVAQNQPRARHGACMNSALALVESPHPLRWRRARTTANNNSTKWGAGSSMWTKPQSINIVAVQVTEE